MTSFFLVLGLSLVKYLTCEKVSKVLFNIFASCSSISVKMSMNFFLVSSR